MQKRLKVLTALTDNNNKKTAFYFLSILQKLK